MSLEQTVTVDAEGPRIDWRWEGPFLEQGAVTVLTPATRARVTAEDPAGASVVRYRWSEDEASASGFPRPLPANAQTLRVTAVDGLGHRSEATRAVEIDGDGPAIDVELLSALGSAPGFSTRPARLRARAEDARLPARILAPSPSGDTGTATFEIEGSSVTVVAEDALGNRSTRALSWRYDEEPPTADLIHAGGRHAPDAIIWLAAGDPVSFAVADAGVGVAEASYHYNELPPRPLPKTLRLVDRGRYWITVDLLDHEGNRGSYRWVVVAR